MTVKRALKPSPLVGEGGARSAPGEGASRARTLRRSMTEAERKLWLALRDRRLAGVKFRRQVPLGPFIADFASYEHRLILEVDGGQHSDSASDLRRDQWLREHGFRVLRFWNNDVLKNLDGVLQRIIESVQEATPHPARASRGHPSPTRGEGSSAPRRHQPLAKGDERGGAR